MQVCAAENSRGTALHISPRFMPISGIRLQIHGTLDGNLSARPHRPPSEVFRGAPSYAGIGPFWGRHPAWQCSEVPTCASDRSCRHLHPAGKRVADEGAAGAKPAPRSGSSFTRAPSAPRRCSASPLWTAWGRRQHSLGILRFGPSTAASAFRTSPSFSQRSTRRCSRRRLPNVLARPRSSTALKCA